MRTFEYALLFGCALAIVWPALFGVRSRRGIVSGLLVVLLILQWRLEGFRWQLIGLVAVAIGLAVGDVMAVERDLPVFRRVGRGIFGLAGLGLAVAAAVAFPVPDLPLPSGPLAIGTAAFEVSDPERPETFPETPSGVRRFAVRVWYPAQAADDPPLGVDPDVDVLGPALAEKAGVPGFFFNHLRLVDSHAVENAPALGGSFPLIVYSHDWMGFKSDSLDTVENLVSQGYVVVAIDHTYSAITTVLRGEAIPAYPPALEPPETAELDPIDAQGQLVEIVADDIATTLGLLEQGVGGPFAALAGVIDVGAVGVWGTGLGGGGAVQFCLEDERCDAVAASDPWVEALSNRILAVTATHPMMLIRSDTWRDTTNDAILRGIAERSETFTYWVDVFGADHSDFTAVPLFSPIADRIGMKGPIDGDVMVAINHRLITGFFDQFILGTGSAALDTADFGAVDIERIDNS